MTDIQNLIAHLEAASEGSRELDAAIWEIEPCEPPDCNLRTKAIAIVRLKAGGDDAECPAYTTSLDAALTLVPEGWLWDIASTGCVWGMPEHSLDDQIVISGISNPKIAVCILALKARAVS